MIRGRKHNHYPCKLIRIIDGDTVLLDVDLGLGFHLTDLRLRLARIDAPELDAVDVTTQRAAIASSLSLQKLLECSTLLLVTSGDRKDVYGRLIGELFRIDPATGGPGQNASEHQIRTGHAKIFDPSA